MKAQTRNNSRIGGSLLCGAILIALLLCYASVGTAWADSFTLDNDTDIIDSFIKKNDADANFGTTSNFFLYNAGANVYRFVITFQNLNDSIGVDATINSALFYWVNGNVVSSDRYIFFYGIWKPYWTELDISWNEWGMSQDSTWTDPGAECANDAGAFNKSRDDDGCVADSADRQSTYIDSLTVLNGTADGDTLVADITAWISTCYQNSENPSIMAATKGSAGIYIYTREASADYKPWIVIEYTTNGEPAVTNRRQILLRSE